MPDVAANAHTITIKLGTFAQGRRPNATSLATPPHLFGSPDFRIMRAWIEAEAASPAPRCHRPVLNAAGEEERCTTCPACKVYAKTVVAAVVSAIERCQGQRNTSGQPSDVYERLPKWMRPHFGLPAGEGLKRLIGRWDKQGTFQPAQVAAAWRLTEDEAKVYWWDIRGWTFEEIQRELTAKGLRHDRTLWTDAEDVQALLDSARGKVQDMFELNAA